MTIPPFRTPHSEFRIQPMLPAQVDSEIRRLLAARVSQRQIAARLDIGRASVQRIANGRRVRGGRNNDELRYPQFAAPDVLPKRCGGCGGLVYMPCVLCRARRHRGTKNGH